MSMDQILDQGLTRDTNEAVRYAGFLPRLAALIIDGIVLAPLTLGVMWLNIATWKSPVVFILASLISLAYKPAMESLYGATVGKMALDLRVVNLEHGRADIRAVLLRNVFHIGQSLMTFFLSLTVFTSQAIESVSGYLEFSIASQSSLSTIVNLVTFVIVIIDLVVMLSDQRNRSWHDKIGGTYVVERKSLDRPQ